MDTSCRELKSQITQSMVLLITLMAIVGTVFCANALAGTGQDDASVEPEMSSTKAGVMKYAQIAASIAFGLGREAGGRKPGPSVYCIGRGTCRLRLYYIHIDSE